MSLNILGEEMSLMRIGKRQLAARVTMKAKQKPTVVIKKKSIPTETPFIAEVWAKFGRAAHSAFGKSMEEVNMAVAQAVSGTKTGAEHYQNQKRIHKHDVITPNNLARFERIAARSGEYTGMGGGRSVDDAAQRDSRMRGWGE